MTSSRLRWLSPSASRFAALAVIALFIFHFAIIYRNVVNIPYWDDWAMFRGSAPETLSLQWLFAQHNEHRIATTKFLVWLQCHMNGWNYSGHILLNFLIYGLLLLGLVQFSRKAIPESPLWVMLAFIVFFLSPMNAFNNFMAIQTVAHFDLIFFLGATYFLCRGTGQSWRDLVIGCLLAILAIYSFAAAIPSCLAMLFGFAFLKGRRIAVMKGERRREAQQLLFVILIVGIAIALWTIGYHKHPGHPDPTSPLNPSFWTVIFNLTSFGFGYERVSWASALVCFAAVTTPIVGSIWTRRLDLTGPQWASFIMVLGIFAMFGSIAIGRTGFGVSAASKADRYWEFCGILIPLSVINWRIWLGPRRLTGAVLCCLWLLCAAGFRYNWNFGDYEQKAAARTAGRECVRAYYEGRGPALCPTVYPATLQAELDHARQLNASFYRDLNLDGLKQPDK